MVNLFKMADHQPTKWFRIPTANPEVLGSNPWLSIVFSIENLNVSDILLVLDNI
jgi:hypothetical protein